MKALIKARCTTQKNQLQYSKDKLREFTKKLSLLFCVKKYTYTDYENTQRTF